MSYKFIYGLCVLDPRKDYGLCFVELQFDLHWETTKIVARDTAKTAACVFWITAKTAACVQKGFITYYFE